MKSKHTATILTITLCINVLLTLYIDKSILNELCNWSNNFTNFSFWNDKDEHSWDILNGKTGNLLWKCYKKATIIRYRLEYTEYSEKIHNTRLGHYTLIALIWGTHGYLFPLKKTICVLIGTLNPQGYDSSMMNKNSSTPGQGKQNFVLFHQIFKYGVCSLWQWIHTHCQCCWSENLGCAGSYYLIIYSRYMMHISQSPMLLHYLMFQQSNQSSCF